ncbi:hypothetical protein BT63DRAFT_460302 [Microthyrium microscopicum]|uniref:Uncharacterized protein n=1 Tax=Microthyrium microscopicum TaxID=703497 RepID=A0A6A6TXK8_9PEZI|nr:hypothetical protein BT63DRAFT_460302 [Microthyrium microscopicum]
MSDELFAKRFASIMNNITWININANEFVLRAFPDTRPHLSGLIYNCSSITISPKTASEQGTHQHHAAILAARRSEVSSLESGSIVPFAEASAASRHILPDAWSGRCNDRPKPRPAIGPPVRAAPARKPEKGHLRRTTHLYDAMKQNHMSIRGLVAGFDRRDYEPDNFAECVHDRSR